MVNVSLSNIDNLERTWISLIFLQTLPLLVVSLLFVLIVQFRPLLPTISAKSPSMDQDVFFHASLHGASQYNGYLGSIDGKTITLCYCQIAFPAHCYQSLNWIWVLLLKGSKKDSVFAFGPKMGQLCPVSSVQCPPCLCSEWKQQQYQEEDCIRIKAWSGHRVMGSNFPGKTCSLADCVSNFCKPPSTINW